MTELSVQKSYFLLFSLFAAKDVLDAVRQLGLKLVATILSLRTTQSRGTLMGIEGTVFQATSLKAGMLTRLEAESLKPLIQLKSWECISLHS